MLNSRQTAQLRILKSSGDLVGVIYDALNSLIDIVSKQEVEEDLSSQVTGSASEHTTTYPYRPNTLQVWVHGIYQGPDSVGWISQTQPGNGKFGVATPIVQGNKLVVRYVKV